MKSKRILFYVLVIFVLFFCFSLVVYNRINAQDEGTDGILDDDTSSSDDDGGISGDDTSSSDDDGGISGDGIDLDANEPGEDLCVPTSEPGVSYDFSKSILLPAIARPPQVCSHQCTRSPATLVADTCEIPEVPGLTGNLSLSGVQMKTYTCTSIGQKCNPQNFAVTCRQKVANTPCVINYMNMLYYGASASPHPYGCTCEPLPIQPD